MRMILKKLTSSLETLPSGRMRAALAATPIMLILFIANLPRLFFPAPLSNGAGQMDYAAFYGAAQAALTNIQANLYDQAAFQEVIGLDTSLLWLYPPHFLTILAPLGALPYPALKVFLALSMCAIVYLMARHLMKGVPVAILAFVISPAAFTALFVGQINAVFAGLLMAGLLLAKRSPLLAGIAIALLTIKPQYGLLIIPFLIINKAWRAFFWASLITALLVGVSVLLYGMQPWIDFFDSITGGVHAGYYQSDGHTGRITLSDGLKALSLSPPPALLLYGTLLIMACVAMWRLRGNEYENAVIAFVMAATACTSPYFLVYDYLILNAAVLLLMRDRKELNPNMQLFFIAIWVAPIIPLLFGGPLLPALLWPINVVFTACAYRLAVLSSSTEPTHHASTVTQTDFQREALS